MARHNKSIFKFKLTFATGISLESVAALTLESSKEVRTSAPVEAGVALAFVYIWIQIRTGENYQYKTLRTQNVSFASKFLSVAVTRGNVLDCHTEDINIKLNEVHQIYQEEQNILGQVFPHLYWNSLFDLSDVHYFVLKIDLLQLFERN